MLIAGPQSLRIKERGFFEVGLEATRGERDHVATTKGDGGRVYIEVHENGEVTVHEGFVTSKEHQRKTVGEVCRRIGVSEQSYYRWRKEYGGLKIAQARRLKGLEQENARLKRAVANLTLDKLILREAAEGNF